MPDGVASPPPSTRTPPPPPTPSGGAPSPPSPPKQNLQDWMRNHKAATVGGAVAIGLGIFLFAKWRSNQSSSSSSTTSSTTGGDGTTPSVYQLAPGAYEGWNGGTGGNGGDLSGALASIEQSLTGIQTSLNKGGNAGGTTTPAYNYASERFVGGGYLGQGNVPGLRGGIFQNIPGGMGTANLKAQGITEYYQPTPGTFVPVNWKTFKEPTKGPATPLYIRGGVG